MSRTPSGFPGWYIDFQTALLKQAPRPEEISQRKCKAWCDNQGGLKNVLRAALCTELQSDCFELVKTVEIIVPDNYDHTTQLASFANENRGKFYGYDNAITDENFGNATTKLAPGRKFAVKIFRQAIPRSTTSEERMAFLRSQGVVFTGAQGASLVFTQKRDELPKGFGYSSFDEKEALWTDSAGNHRVPCLYHSSDGDWYFRLGAFEGGWDGGHCLLCFCDLG